MATARDVINAAKAHRKTLSQTLTMPGWDMALTVVPATAREQYSALEIARKEALARGGRQVDSLNAHVAWVLACVKEPKFNGAEVYELAQADPGNFEKLAEICEAISRGTPLPLLMLHAWAGLAESLQEREAAGQVPVGSSAFWRSIAGAFAEFVAGDGGADPQAVAKALAESDAVTAEDGADVLQAFFAEVEDERKNVSEGSSDSGAPASSTSDGPPENSSETDGTGTTSPS